MEKLSMDALNRLSTQQFRDSQKLPLVLVLDNVRSGANVGSAFRSADAFLIEKIVLCGITAQPPHREILKTALGSTESVTWQYFATALEAVQSLQSNGYQVFALEQTSQKIWLQDFTPAIGTSYAFVFGNEVEGVDEAVLRQCNGVLEIPQFGTKHSLNVAVSVGIVLWEIGMKMRI